jgi:hypothetical protein
MEGTMDRHAPEHTDALPAPDQMPMPWMAFVQAATDQQGVGTIALAVSAHHRSTLLSHAYRAYEFHLYRQEWAQASQVAGAISTTLSEMRTNADAANRRRTIEGPGILGNALESLTHGRDTWADASATMRSAATKAQNREAARLADTGEADEIA